VHTRTVASLADHPLVRFLRCGVKVTVNTDNRTVSKVTASQELARAWYYGELTVVEVKRILLNGVEAAFLPAEEKVALKVEFEEAFQELLAGVEEL